jgi:hypothetical protein
MGKRCDDCPQIIPDHLWTIHQDEHFAKRLAEELENNQYTEVDQTLARALAVESANSDSLQNLGDDADYEFALALNRKFRIEEEQNSFRAIQVKAFLNPFDSIQEREWGVESPEEERESKFLKLDEPRSNSSNQLILGPDLIPIQNQLLSNETPGISNRNKNTI